MRRLTNLLVTSLVIGLAGCADISGSQSDVVTGKNAAGAAMTATYVVSGPNGFTATGSVQVTNTSSVAVTVSGLPVGDGYVMTVTTPVASTGYQCIGSTSFNVAADAGTSFNVTVPLVCGLKGTASVTGTFNICPVIDGLSGMPTSLALGGTTTFSLTAHDTDNGPGPMTYSWAVNGVSATTVSVPSFQFTCTSVGQSTITATVSDGDPTPSCAANSSIKVSCE